MRSGARSTGSSSWPRGFPRQDADDVVGVICREARSTFGADYGVLWRVRDEGLDLLAIDPPRPDIVETHLRLDDFPRLREAIEGLGASFVPDVLETTYGEGFEFVRELGIRSSLRTPVVIAGSSELVLAISWQVVVSEPDQATLAVVRRFADQAGLALEQVERRRAEADAERRADATRRLQEVTAALSVATTVLDVSNACLEKALESVGAEAGFVVLKGPTGHAHGRDRHELGLRRRRARGLAGARSRLGRPFRTSDRLGRARLGAVGRRRCRHSPACAKLGQRGGCPSRS